MLFLKPRLLPLAPALILAVSSLTARALEPCALLTVSQIGSALGTPVQAGAPGPKNCMWRATSNSENLVYLTLRTADNYAFAKSNAQAASMFKAVSGVGTDAFFLVGPKGADQLYILKGANCVVLRAHSPHGTPDQNESAMKTLGTQAAGAL